VANGILKIRWQLHDLVRSFEFFLFVLFGPALVLRALNPGDSPRVASLHLCIARLTPIKVHEWPNSVQPGVLDRGPSTPGGSHGVGQSACGRTSMLAGPLCPIRPSRGFWLCAIQPLAIARVDVLAPILRKLRPRGVCLYRVLIQDSCATLTLFG
jgi:hypothetical protein